jgi:glycosyltransferase involved in cell wall biosynthesis
VGLTIAYDATAAVRQRAGIGRYTRELLAALARRDDDLAYRVFYCAGGAPAGRLPPLDARFHARGVPVSDRIMNLVWHRARLPVPMQLFTGSFDLYHSPDFTLPPVMNKPTVLTVHDLAFLTAPENAYPTLREYLKRVVPPSARRATHVIAVSENTRQDCIRLLDIPPERITTIHEGVGAEFQPPVSAGAPSTTLRALGIDEPYILSVGTLEPRKNYCRLFEAYASLRRCGVRHPLVIAGRRGWLFEPILQRIHDLGLDEQVLLVEPDDRQLVDLLGAACVFVYPSLYEGFGIPPLEAMACGAVVACSNSSSLPEVVGDAAITFDPLDSEGMADAIQRLIEDQELRASLAVRGRVRAASFTWEAAAEGTVRIYGEVARA